MLTLRSINLTSVRGLHMTSQLCKDNPEYVKFKREAKERQEARWMRKRSQNPFGTNVGVSRTMKVMGRDPDDASLTHLGPNDLNRHANPAEQIESIMEGTKPFQEALDPKRAPNVDPGLDRVWFRRVMSKKRFFPDPPTPPLLTFVEREVMKELHRSEPGHWTVEALADAFPATETIVKKVLKSNHGSHAKNIVKLVQDYDKMVANNWKLLSEGKLEIDPALVEHLERHFGPQFANKRREIEKLTSEMSEKVMQRRLKEAEERFKPFISGGPAGNIIADYNNKVKAKELAIKGGKNEDKSELNISETGNPMLKVAEVDPELNVPSPFRETSLLNAGINIKSQRPMTMDAFKQKFIDKILEKSDQKSVVEKEKFKEDNPHKAAYEDWLRKEAQKDRKVKKFEPLEIGSILDELSEEKAAEAFKSKKSESKTKSLEPVSDPVKEIEKEEKLNDVNSLHDSEGELIFRIPVETMKTKN